MNIKILEEYASDLNISVESVKNVFAVLNSIGWIITSRGSLEWRHVRGYYKLLAKIIEKGEMDKKEVDAFLILFGRKPADNKAMLVGWEAAGVIHNDGGIIRFRRVMKKERGEESGRKI